VYIDIMNNITGHFQVLLIMCIVELGISGLHVFKILKFTYTFAMFSCLMAFIFPCFSSFNPL
jgi:hypothetical protein